MFLAPTWEPFQQPGAGCIHSTSVDGDRLGRGAQRSGKGQRLARDRSTGIHCLLTADVDQDGRDDVIINNFEPARGIPDSIALSVPKNPYSPARLASSIRCQRGWMDGRRGRPAGASSGQAAAVKLWSKTVLAVDEPGATSVIGIDVNQDGKTDWAEVKIPTASHRPGDPLSPQPDLGSSRPADVVSKMGSRAAIFITHQIDSDQESSQDGDGDAIIRGSKNVVWYENPAKQFYGSAK